MASSKLVLDKSIIITGAATGIGRSAALLFAREGARLALADVDEKRVQQTAAMARDEGAEAFAIQADVSKEGDVRALVEHTVKNFGRLDAAFNNAGIEGAMAPLAECSRENWDRTIAVNLTGTYLCMQVQIRQMLAQQDPGGAIVNNASVAGLVGFAGLPAYVASKHAICGLTKSTALELAERRVRVNAVCPGVIQTEMVERVTGGDKDAEAQFTALEPMGRMGRAEEVAEAALWLCSDRSSFVTGECMTVDGGFVAR